MRRIQRNTTFLKEQRSACIEVVEIVHEDDDKHDEIDIINVTTSGNKTQKNQDKLINHAEGSEYDEWLKRMEPEIRKIQRTKI
jgi:hypothetical protein